MKYNSGLYHLPLPLPCYVMEEDLLRNNLQLIKEISQKADVQFILAFKAFALWKSFPIFREYIKQTTASSPYEARLAFEEFGSKAHTYSPAYEDSTFDEILKCSSHITFNSLSQYERYIKRVSEYEEPASCGIRVNPEYAEIETELYNPCAPGSRFGIMATDLPDVLPPGIEGFHLHCHCENNSDVFQRTLKHFVDKFQKWLPLVKWVNFGGGHLVTEENYNVDLLIHVLNDFHKRYPWLQIILEPGSAFAWQTGCLVAQVVDIVENCGIKTAIVNVSFTCHMPDCLEMPYHPQIVGAKIVDSPEVWKEENTYRIGGNSCLSGDFMGFWNFDHPLQVGERIIFEDMIHYTTVKTNMFNGIHHPSIALLHSDGQIEVYKNYSYDDYKNRMC
ncbi:MAG: carboxynorspermidine decarboxylase [Bacteroidaceae bacterium]